MLARCIAGFEIEDEVFASELRRDDRCVSAAESALWTIHLHATMDRARQHADSCIACARPDTPVEHDARTQYCRMRGEYHRVLYGACQELPGQLATASSGNLTGHQGLILLAAELNLLRKHLLLT